MHPGVASTNKPQIHTLVDLLRPTMHFAGMSLVYMFQLLLDGMRTHNLHSRHSAASGTRWYTLAQLRKQLARHFMGNRVALQCKCLIQRNQVSRITHTCSAHVVRKPPAPRTAATCDMPRAGFISPPSNAAPGAYWSCDCSERGARKESAQRGQSASGLTVKLPATWRPAEVPSAARSLPSMSSRPSAPPFGGYLLCLQLHIECAESACECLSYHPCCLC